MSKRIAIAATFTAEPLGDVLAFWFAQLTLSVDLAFAPYNQTLQQLLDPSGLFATNRDGLNVVLVRFEDWLRFDGGLSSWVADPISAQAKLDRGLTDLTAALSASARLSPAPIQVVICPPSANVLRDEKLAGVFEALSNRLAGKFSPQGLVTIVPPAAVLDAYDVVEVNDSAADELGHVPYSTEFFAALGTTIARYATAIFTPRRKVLVVDCDETLWRGVCGEVGAQGVEIDPASRRFQEFVVGQQQRGVVVALCSKNAETDVLDVFDQRKDMILTRDDVAASRINWEPKSTNLRALAGELQLGLDSFVFVDDNPVECAEVRSNCPGVLVLERPAEAFTLDRMLKHIWPLDRAHATNEDEQRTEFYRQERERSALRESTATLNDFLASLELHVEISDVEEKQIARVAQLIERTNQFNLSGIRRSEAELRHLLATGTLRCLVTHARDRFGDYGLVGVVLFGVKDEAVEVDTFLLSCRALGRGVEHRMLASVGKEARALRRARVELAFEPSAKNEPARRFLQTLDLKPCNGLNRISADEACAAKVCAAPSSAVEIADRKADVAVADENRANIFQRIAHELNTTSAIVEAIAAWRLRDGEILLVDDEREHTPLELAIADAWGEVLGVARVGLNQNFFELGGDSLLATLIVSRLRQSFPINLPLHALFDFPTVADLASVILQELAETSMDDLDSFDSDFEAWPQAGAV